MTDMETPVTEEETEKPEVENTEGAMPEMPEGEGN